jgi:hypothetical protein
LRTSLYTCSSAPMQYLLNNYPGGKSAWT